jgi:hypothetical protein
MAMLSDVRHTRSRWAVAECRRERPGVLMSASEFRAFAAEHFDWARTATSDRERETFEQMARAWLAVAAVWDDSTRVEGRSLEML